MADVVVGAKLSLDANDSIKSLKQVKTEIKSATGELLLMQQQFGNNSKEAIAAAKRVAELKDQIQEAREVADLFDPGKKFQAFSGAVNSVLGGFTALTGAMGLLGVESENVQKQLLKVQSALSLSQGLSQVADSAKDFQRLGTVLVQTLGKNGLIGVAIAGVTALGLAIYSVFKNTKTLTDEQKRYNEVSDIAFKNDGQRIAQLQILIDKVKKGGLTQSQKTETLKNYNETLGDTLGKYDTYQKLEDALISNGPKYIQYLETKAKADAAYGLLVEEQRKLIEQERTKASEFTGFSILGIFFDDDQTHETNKKKVLDRTRKDVGDITKLYGGLVDQAEQIKNGLGIVTTTDPKTTTPRTAAAKAENKEIELQYSTSSDNLLLLQQEREKKFLENKNLFIEEGKRLDNEEFNEKIALLNLELDIEENAAKARQLILDKEAQAKIKTQELVANSLSIFADLVGKETAAGKVLAIASATVNTYLAATQALKADYSIYGPAAQFARIAAVVSTIALGLKQVKEIAKVKVPGRSGGGGNVPSGSSVSAPLQPQAPQATRTQLDQDQLNQIGNATVRAFVVESDVTSNQDRIRRLNRAARL